MSDPSREEVELRAPTDDRSQPMRDGQHERVRELVPNGTLEVCVCRKIDRCSGLSQCWMLQLMAAIKNTEHADLVHDDDFAAPQEGSSHSKESVTHKVSDLRKSDRSVLTVAALRRSCCRPPRLECPV